MTGLEKAGVLNLYPLPRSIATGG